MFSKETRKSNINKIITNVEKYMYNNIYPNNTVNGFVILLVHWIIVGITGLYILFGKVDTIFYNCVVMWIIIITLHFYFNGCILTKLERHLWNTNTWNGPWMLPFKLIEKLNIKITSKIMNYTFITWGIFLSSFIILKIFNST
jgi:hypothetical protein